jgi:hypothetical protein
MPTLSQVIKDFAKSFIDKDNVLLSDCQELSERLNNDQILFRASEILTSIASELDSFAQFIEEEEKKLPKEEELSVEKLEMMAALATEFDESGDEFLQKQASVIDEILLTISADQGLISYLKKAEDREIDKIRSKMKEDSIKEKYTGVKEKLDIQAGVEESKKIIEEKIKEYKPLQHSLSTRYSPDMPGVQLIHVGDGVYQCPVTKKIFNFEAGYTTSSGQKVPGTSVENQTKFHDNAAAEHFNFSSRDEILNRS